MFKVLACHGTSHESRAIEFLTGPRSHIRIQTERDITGIDSTGNIIVVKAGSCFEAWNTGVRVIDRWDTGYDKGTIIEAFSLREQHIIATGTWGSLTEDQFAIGARFLCRQVGKQYNWPGCSRLALPPGARPTPDYATLGVWNYPMYFCSEVGAALFVAMDIPCFNSLQPYDVTPQLLVESLRFNAVPEVLTV